jgi:hypothetical protein
MKTYLTNNIILVILLSLTISSLNGQGITQLKQNLDSDSHNIAIDLVTLGALPLSLDKSAANSPSVSELMRDTYVRITVNTSESIEESNASANTTSNDITYEEYQANQRKKFCGIFCLLLLIFSLLALYDSSLFKKSNKVQSDNSAKLSISRIVLYVSVFLFIGTLISSLIVNHNLPGLSLNSIVLLGIIILTYMINLFLEKHDNGDNHFISIKSKKEGMHLSQTNISHNKILKYIQYPIVSLINITVFMVPTWSEMQMLKVFDEQIVIQLISSLILLLTYSLEINLLPAFFSRQEFKHQNNY